MRVSLIRGPAWTLVFGAFIVATPARADFGPRRRSINGTGETLPAGEAEVGVGSVAYGVTSQTMVRAPSLGLLVGYGRAEVRYKSVLADGIRAAPYAFLEAPRHGGIGGDFGWDFGDDQANSLTIGARLRHGPLATADGKKVPKRRQRTALRPNAEYDRYLGGNLAYVGVADYLLYAGFTWSWESFHLGLVMSPASGLIPLPYVYWRF